MPQVHSSNYLESLLDQLLTRVNQGDPFDSEVIVVENPGMSRWLQQRIAEFDGISANLTFISPAQFIWQSAQCWIADLPAPPQRNSTRLQWQIFQLLPEFLSQSAFEQLQKYLEGDESGVQRFQLAGRIAGAFERYLIYRTDLIEAWQRGKEVHWQAILWRAIAADMPHTWGDIRNQLAELTGTPPQSPLPARVSVFGVSDMPPLFIDLFQWFGSHTSVCIYYLNPCAEYWADIQDAKSQARRRAKAYQQRADHAQDPTGLLDIGNPLLASWGHAGQAFLDQLLERQIDESESFVTPDKVTLLHAVQRDILLLEDKSDGSGGEVAIEDHSVCIHAAHSPLREVQVLHDQLLNLFATNPELTPRDIIVMAPDIDKYAPFVNATFGTAPAEQFIPWSISDRRLRSEQQLLEALLVLLQLPESRLESTDIVALLQVPAVRRKFSFERRDLDRLQQWVQESGIRWSLDAAMREELGLPTVQANSWEFGFKRMFLGYAMPAMDDRLYEGIAPYSELEGADSDRLEKLQLFMDLVRYWRTRLADGKHAVLDWLAEIDQLSEVFFEPDHSEDFALRSFRDALLATFTEAGGAVINLQVLTEVVQSALDDNNNVRQFLNGKVTFSNMVPMRCIPFKVICILGLNADDFPREDRPMSFDLTVQQPRRGDRSRANDDRYLFLETLLSAREVLYLSYVGSDIRDNTDKAPATVVTELLAYMNASYTRSDADAISVLAHPLQPFSKRYFDGLSEFLFSYKPLWFDAASTKKREVAFMADTESRDHPEGSSTSQVDKSHSLAALEAPSKQVSLSQLVSFITRPSESFLAERLQVGRVYVEDNLQSTEPFELDGLERWAVDQRVLEYGREMPRSEVRRTLDAQGVLPAGAFGDIYFDASYQRAIALDARVIAHEPKTPLAPIDFELSIGEYSLHGMLSNLGANGMFFWRAGKKRTTDLLSTWVRHLCLCASASELASVPKRSIYVFTDVTVEFTAVAEPLTHLQVLLDLRHQGMLTPQPFFPETSLAYVTADDAETGLSKAQKAWFTGATAERHKNSHTIVWRGRDYPFNQSFRDLAQQVYEPLLRHMEQKAEKDELPDTLPEELYDRADESADHGAGARQ